MRKEIKLNSTIRLLMLILLVVIFSTIVFLFCYYSDNKYTIKSSRAENGVLILSEQDLQEYPFVYLSMGWEIYRGKLLSPKEFATGLILPDEYVFIGQYGGLEGKTGSGRSPHGSATYRLNISLPSEVKSYILELPEIYSAYRLYINGELLEQLGEPNKESYYGETRNSKVSIRCADRIEIIIAVSDYNHFYSGMVYPPAFGEASAIEKVLNTRFGIRFAAIVLALVIGFLYFGIWLLLKKNKKKTYTLPLYYVALCLCFALYICYPVVKTLTTIDTRWYTIENITLPAMLFVVIGIQSQITGLSGLLTKLTVALGIFVCGWAVTVPNVMGDSLNLMIAHAIVLANYTWISALFLLLTSVYSVYQNKQHSKILLTGSVVFGTSLVMDRLFPLFEPIRFGWFSEMAGGFFVLSIGTVMAYEVAEQFRRRFQLEEQVNVVTHMMEVQKTYYSEVLKKEEELSLIRHDFRHHMAVLHELASIGDLSKLIMYVELFGERIGVKTHVSFCKHYFTDMLLRMYAGLAKAQDTQLEVETVLPDTLPFADIDICVIISNLLENALEASLRIPKENRKITIRIRCKMSYFGIAVDNVFDGVIKTNRGHFLSLKRDGRKGIGLASVREVCEIYGGSAEFYIKQKNIFHSEALLPINLMNDHTTDIIHN